MLDIVICSLNSKYSHSALAPWCLLAGIRSFARSDVNTSIVEGTVNESADDVFRRIMQHSPAAVGFCTYIWNIGCVKMLAERIKNCFPQIKIILGGPEVSYNADELLSACDHIDFIISGEGEKPIAVLADALNGGTAIPDGYGICYKSDGKIICSEPYISCEEPPSPYCDEFFAALGNRIPYIETSRGCPYSCAFCLSGRCGGVRFFDMERTKKEILTLAAHTSSTIKFVDRTFNANKRRAKEIFRFICENYGKAIPEGVCCHFEIAGDILDDETIGILNNAPKGSVQLEIGMQSFNEKTLAYINRKTDTSKLRSNITRLIAPQNIHIHIDLIAGLPFEDMESFKESFNIGFGLNANMLQMGFLKLLHGADMREKPERYPCEFSDLPPYEVISTPWLSKSELCLLKNTEDALDRIHNSGRFKRTEKYILEKSGLAPFDIFFSFGNYAAQKSAENISLDDYIGLIYEYFGSLNGIDKAYLRDEMVCDRFAVNSFGMLPPALQIKEPVLIAKAKKILESDPATKRQKNIKRSIAILYSRKSPDGSDLAVYADYNENDKNRHGISAPEYKLNFFRIK